MDEDNMEIDSPLTASNNNNDGDDGDVNKSLNPSDRIVQRLLAFGVPSEVLDRGCSGLVSYVEKEELKFQFPEIVSAILPSNEHVRKSIFQSKSGFKGTAACLTMKDQFRESMVWLQWLMFRGDPQAGLNSLAEKSVGQRGVCGAVWGSNDIAYRCRTCEHDPTCAICVPCFQDGNHEDHDYSIIYTGGGCCDCGDATAWKREGFCSKHKGAEQIQPLPNEFADTVSIVLDPLFLFWRERILCLESTIQKNPRGSDRVAEHKKLANEMTFAVVEMLLEFCKYSESLLSLVSARVSFLDGLLGCLVRAEGILMESVVKKLHELLLKLLADPVFKYEFSKVFLSYYPLVIREVVKESSDDALKRYPLLSTFSVQIFTVPTLTPQLVKEMNLLHTLLECLGDIFNSCAEEDGRLQLSKWANLFEITIRVVEDIRFVMSHDVVPKYVIQFQRDVIKSWMSLLAFVQEMNPQKRETGIHIEEETESTHLPSILCNSICNIHSLLVNGASSMASDENSYEGFLNSDRQDVDDGDERHTKVGRLSEECSVGTATGRSMMSASLSKTENESDLWHSFIPPSVVWLTRECVRAMERAFIVDGSSGSFNESSQGTCNMSVSNFLAAKLRRGKNKFGRLNSSNEGQPSHSSLPASAFSSSRMSSDLLYSQSTGKEEDLVSMSCSPVPGLNKTLAACAAEGALRLLYMAEWPDITYDVSSQEVSVHIPFHRLLSLLLQKALRRCYGESATPIMNNLISYNEPSPNFFSHLLSGYHAHGFAAFIMERPLRIRVFFAEVHAGMWRRNGDAPLVSWECYRSIRWSGQDLDLDLFLLQCCAAMAPADVYLTRILERFGLSTYLSLSLGQCSEYEPTLVQEMLTLIIQVVKERRYCGVSTADSLKRELVCKLATGDATRSKLVKSLPRDLSKSVELEETLDVVAQYSKPSGFNQGMYSLRRAYWKELDLYHPRWSSRDLQLAEERYSRFSGAFALTTQLPRWTSIYHPLKAVARVATCKAAVVIIRAVLFYAVFSDKKTESRAPDSVVLTALHFLSLGLDICSQHREDSELSCFDGDVIPLLAFSGEEIDEGLLCGAEGAGGHSLLSLLVSLMRMHKRERLDSVLEAGNYNLSALMESLLKKFAEMDQDCMTKLQQLAPEVVSNLAQNIRDDGKCVCETVSDSEQRKAKARERQAAILAKMKAEQSKFLKSLDNTVDKELESGQECDVTLDSQGSQESCSLCHDPNSRVPVSYLVLLQKSRLLSITNRGPPLWDCANSSDKNQIYIPGNCANSRTLMNTLSSSSEGASSSYERVPLDVIQNLVNELGKYGSPGEAEAFLRFIKDRLPSARNIQAPSKPMHREERTEFNFDVLEKEIYTSILLEMDDHMEQLDTMEDVEEDVTKDKDPNRESKSFLFGRYIASLSRDASEICSSSDDRTHNDSASKLSAHDGFSPAECDGIYISSCGHAVHKGCLDRYLSSLKERYVRRVIFEGGHIVDPDQGEFLCPVCRRLANAILPALPEELHRGVCSRDATGPLMLTNHESHSLSLDHAIRILRCAGNAFRNNGTLIALSLQCNEKKKADIESISRMLSKMYFPGRQERFFQSSRINHSMIMWDTFKYSLVSIEIAARCGRKSLKPNCGVQALYRELDSSSGFILSLLLKFVQSTHSSHYLHLIQRFRGMQLLAESICYGRSLDYFCNSSVNSDYMLDFLRLVESDLSYPDIQFWNQASDPVLAQDPFSSLMWVLFCLPKPFLSCEKTFLSLVHLFYVVSVTQAIIACSGKIQDMMDEKNYSSCLVTEIFEFVKKFEYARQYFVLSHIDASYNIKDLISILSLPFLRRCALLWKLLKSSAAAPFHGGGNMFEGSSNATADVVDSELECGEIEELQNMFKIPPLDLILNDQSISSLVSKWCAHFRNDFELHSFCSTKNVTPAVPFKLMVLPHLYQDLLQRCIKQCCPDCKTPLIDPALCLLCGRLCSSSWKSCCRQGGCQSHAMDCGAGTGVFLLIKKTTILLQRSARQAPWPSPYLDAFGEEDVEMQRGKPLYLNEERYAALTYMVASHGLDQSSTVLRQTTIGSFFLV